MTSRMPLSNRRPMPILLLGLGLAALSAGCGPSGPPVDVPNAAAQPVGEVKEYWDVHYLGGSKVGLLHGRIEPIVQDGKPLFRYAVAFRLNLLREGQPITQELTITSVETPDAELLSFETQMTAGAANVLTRGVRSGEELLIEVATAGRTETSRIPWSDAYRGIFAVDSSLRNQPMRPGETRTLYRLEPILNRPVRVTLAAAAREPAQLLGAATELLRIVMNVETGAAGSTETILWADAQGEVLKSQQIGLGMTSYRTTKEVALAESGFGSLDLMEHFVVRLKGNLSRPHERRRVRYRVHLEDGDPAEVFPAGPSQMVSPEEDRSAIIEVRAIRPHTPLPAGIAPPPQPVAEDTAPGSLIQSDDEAVAAMARGIAPEETDPWRLAQEIERFVYRSIRKKDYSQAFATAAEVARTLEGDCTEHAVLLAALCRARGIPARVVIGLVHSPAMQGFGYHLWNEVWIADRWVPLDATLGLGGIGGGHLKLADSNLSGVAAYETFLPLQRVLGRLHVEVLELED